MTALLRDDRYRFSLQWSADTEEKVRVGSLLERMGNKKSDFIVMAIMDYLQRHPDTDIPGTKIKVTCHPVHTKEQLRAMVQDLVKSSMNELMQGKTVASVEDNQYSEMPPGPSEQDIDAMLASLKLFDQP